VKMTRIVLRTRDGEYLHEIQPRPEWGPTVLPGPLKDATTYPTEPMDQYAMREAERTWCGDDPGGLTRVRVRVVSTRTVELI
jgi:hypothetical protein